MVIYRERLWPSVSLVLAGLLVIPAVILVLTPVSFSLAVPVAVGAYFLFLAFLFATSPVLEVNGDTFRAGRAEIGHEFISSAKAETRDDTRALLSTRSDARAHLVIRSWIPRAVTVVVGDGRDDTPYWLVSSRKPEDLESALNARKS